MRTTLLSILFSLLFLSDTFAQAPNKSGNVVNYESKGNLEITNQVDCVGFSELSNTLTAADLYNALSKCLEKEEYQNAAEIFALAGVYSTFDKLRVADRSAHQAHAVLTMKAMQGASESGKNRLMLALKTSLNKEGTQLKEVCSVIRKIGHPNYFPNYMIQHGMKAFGGPQENRGIKENFQSDQAWETALDTYLHCPKQK
jgi:hypothetical protein